jgi:multidrug resistance efflux pump
MSVLQNPFEETSRKGRLHNVSAIWSTAPVYLKIGIPCIVVATIVGIKLFSKQNETPAPVKQLRGVTLLSLQDILGESSTLPLVGSVTSVHEATIRTESSGRITRVTKKLGDHVTAGEIIATFENSAERAAVLQAEGSYEQAKAARDIARINTTTTSSSLLEAKNTALNTLSSTYSILDDSIHGKTDTFFSSPREETAKFNLLISDASLTYTLENSRKTIEKMLASRAAINKTLTTESELITELNAIQQETQYIKSYLDNLATAVSKGIQDGTYTQSTIETQKVAISLARTSISGALSSITGARTALIASQNAEAIAGKTISSDGVTTATADAQVKSALGSYNAALARLEKTIVRSPITGTLNSLSIDTGDFVGQFSEVAVVSNNRALEVVTYVTDDDAKRIRIGGPVTLATDVTGIVTRVAQAIDPKTKKIEVRIGITKGEKLLVNGQSVQLAITRSQTTYEEHGATYTLPLSAIKLTPNGAYLFSVSASSTVVAMPITLGALMGDSVQVLSPLSATTTFVMDARGLKDGMEVVVKEKATTTNQ